MENKIGYAYISLEDYKELIEDRVMLENINENLENELNNVKKEYENVEKTICNNDYVPSIDRLDDNKGYSFDNMRIISWKENREKEYATEQHKNVEQILTVTRIKVARIDENGIKTIYQSMSEAGRENNISTSCICECCKGKRRSAKGYRWIYV